MAASSGLPRSRCHGRRGQIRTCVCAGKHTTMRNILITAAILAGLGTFMAQMADRMTPAAATIARPAEPVAMAAQIGTRSVSIPRDGRGHFATDGRIEGQRIRFMVDTGASVIALNEKSAA